MPTRIREKKKKQRGKKVWAPVTKKEGMHLSQKRGEGTKNN